MIAEYYKNRNNCYRDLREARDCFTSGTASQEQIAAAEKALSLMYLYCPEDMMDLVLSTLEESSLRTIYRRLI